MTRDELKKLIMGPIATVPTPFDDDFEVDYGRMAVATQWWVEQGLVKGRSVLKVAAAMGEGPMLSDAEWPALLRTVVQAAKGKAAIMCGLHHKDTKRTIEDAKKAQDLGAIGLQITPPIFNDPSQDDILRFFEAISNAVSIGIMVYNNPWYPGGNVLPETIRKMADFEQVVAIKWNAGEGAEYDDMRTFAHIFNVIDNSVQPIRCHKLGGRGHVQTVVDSYAPHAFRVWDLMEAGKYDEALPLYESVMLPLRKLAAKFSQRSGGQARLKKGMMFLMGMPMGASRPPSLPLNDEELGELRQLLLSYGWPW